jgi:hypothetical protein
MDAFVEKIAVRIGDVPAAAPNHARLSDVARELDDRHPAEPLTTIGGWRFRGSG